MGVLVSKHRELASSVLKEVVEVVKVGHTGVVEGYMMRLMS